MATEKGGLRHYRRRRRPVAAGPCHRRRHRLASPGPRIIAALLAFGRAAPTPPFEQESGGVWGWPIGLSISASLRPRTTANVEGGRSPRLLAGLRQPGETSPLYRESGARSPPGRGKPARSFRKNGRGAQAATRRRGRQSERLVRPLRVAHHPPRVKPMLALGQSAKVAPADRRDRQGAAKALVPGQRRGSARAPGLRMAGRAWLTATLSRQGATVPNGGGVGRGYSPGQRSTNRVYL
jgi:hypothetical protein